QAGEIDNLTVKLGQSILIVLSRFHIGAGIPGVAPHYTPPPTTFTRPSPPTGLNFSSRNLLDSAAGGTFMSITLGVATKLLDDMMINYSEWHTEKAPQGKKVNFVEETSSLSDKIDAIMSMLVNGRSNVDPNNFPLASLVAQEEHVDVNFIKSNNFNNNAYRNNSGNNYRPYPSNNGNGYGNSYGNSYNNSRSTPSGLEVMLKEFISTQTAFNKSVEEKLGKIDILASKVDSLAADVDLLKLKVMPNEDKDIKSFSTANAIQVRINENIRLMAELHARWEREEKLAKENNVAKVWTITTTSNDDASHVAKPTTINGKIIGVGNVSTPSAKREKLPETAKTAETVCDKTAEFFQNIGDNDPIVVDHNGLDFDDCHISEVIKFLQKLARSPNASAINLAFTKHITNALIKAREEKLKLETSIPRKLEDGWEPIIKMKVNDFDCNALCDLGASISVMPKKLYNMLDLPPLKNCYLDVNLADNSIKKPLGRIDNVRITVNNNLVPFDFVVLDIECNASCPIILGRPFLQTVGAIIDMKEGNIKYQFPLKKGTAKKIENRPKALMELYREVTNDDDRTIQRGKIRNIQLPAIRYFTYYLATSILGRENTSNISSYHLAFLVAALTGSTPYHLGALIARRLSNKGPIYGGIVASRIVAYLGLSVDPSDEKLIPIKLDIAAMKGHQFVTTNSNLENIVYRMLFIDGDEREIPLPQADLFSVRRRPWSRSKEEVDEQLRILGFHQQHDSEDAEPSDGYTVTYPGASSSLYQGQDPPSSYYGGATSWAPWG
ncbi:hypothetical protein QYE76_029721, partial [Lolium multiflorum]